MIPAAGGSQRTVVITAGTVFCVLFGLALATLPAHRSSGDAAARAAATDRAREAGFARVDPAAFAPPASITRTAPRQRASVGPAAQLGQADRPGGSPHPGGSSRAAPTASSASSPSAPAMPAHPASAASNPIPMAGPAGATGPSSSAPYAASSAAPLPDAGQVAQAVFDAINSARSGAGLRPLRWNAGLQASAQRHDQAMAAADTLSHQTPGEAHLGTRESDAGVWWWWAGENIAMSGTMTRPAALDLESAMLNEQAPDDGHRQNILAANADAVGVAVRFDTAHHRMWLTEDFAQTNLL